MAHQVDQESGKPKAPRHKGRAQADQAIMLHLAAGVTVRATAKRCDVCETTIYRRLKDPAFVARLESARKDMLDRAIGGMAMGASEATKVLRKLLRDTLPSIRLGAARAILELGTRLRENVDMAQEIAELKQYLADQEKANP